MTKTSRPWSSMCLLGLGAMVLGLSVRLFVGSPALAKGGLISWFGAYVLTCAGTAVAIVGGILAIFGGCIWFIASDDRHDTA